MSSTVNSRVATNRESPRVREEVVDRLGPGRQGQRALLDWGAGIQLQPVRVGFGGRGFADHRC
jgi:hypothetical protein